ncbi:hypothetical protein PYCC9005_005462 [Savitreella phatthalungensis]
MSQAQVEQYSGTSLSAFVVTLLSNGIVSFAFLAVFFLLRLRLKNVYEPRAYIPTVRKERRMEPLPSLGWPLVILNIFRHRKIIIERSGMDSYFFIRYLRFILIVFTPALLLIWPILLPINYAGGLGDNPPAGLLSVKGLDRFAFGNVPRTHTARYWAHIILAYLLISWFCYNVAVEMRHFVETRHDWLRSARHRASPQATTILVNSLPQDRRDDVGVRDLFEGLPGGVRRVWLNRDCSTLLNDVEDRVKIAKKLEAGVLGLMKTSQKGKPNRPHHRVIGNGRTCLPNWLFFIGHKVDTIDWCKEELTRLDSGIALTRENPNKLPASNSAFVQFNRQIAAHMAVQSLPSTELTKCQPRYLELDPRDVIWGNMARRWWERSLLTAAVWAGVIAFTIFFAIPVTFIGGLSNITSLIRVAPFLSFLTNVPPKYQGVITGLVPTVLMAAVLALVPVLMKLGARLQGHPTKTVVSLVVQEMYFFFLFVQLFLVITIASSVTAFINSAVQSPTRIPQLLATNMPKAATFYFSYFVLQGLSVSSGDLAQMLTLVKRFLLAPIVDSTPRQKWRRLNRLQSQNWGTTFPSFTVLACIGMIYSVIAPLILIFVVVAFALFVLDYIYNVMFVLDFDTDTGGLSFPAALNQTFVGAYFLELILTGLFFLVRNQDGNGVPCKVQGIFAIILFGLTIVFHLSLFRAYRPAVHFLPLDAAQLDQEAAVPELEQKDSVPVLDQIDSPPKLDGTDSLPARERLDVGRGQGQSETPQDSPPLSPASVKRALSGKRTSAQIARLRIVQADAAKSRDVEAPVVDENQEDLDEEIDTDDAFQHVALRRTRPCIWLPEDKLGVAKSEVEDLRRRGLWASTANAILDPDTGKVVVAEVDGGLDEDPADASQHDFAQDTQGTHHHHVAEKLRARLRRPHARTNPNPVYPPDFSRSWD